MHQSLPRATAALTAVVALAAISMAPATRTAGHAFDDDRGSDDRGSDASGEDAPRPTSARGQTQPRYSQSEVTPLAIDTRWGTMRGELRRPRDVTGQPLDGTPVIVQVSPYGILNEGLSRYDDINADATANYFVVRGYAYAIVDAVGTHASDGCTAYGGLPERQSTADVVDHLGALPWTNGNVGMIGGSYDGTLAIAAAVEAPEHLQAIIPQVAIDRWYDYMYDDGVRMAAEDSSGRGGALPADPPADSPLDYDLVYGVVPDHTQSPADIASATVQHTHPCNRVENQTRGYEQDPVYDQFWIDRDYRALAGNVTAAVLFEGAWLDDNVKHEAGPSFIGALPDDTPKHLVMGQWTHSTSKFSDAMNLRHAWFDQHLYGLDTGVDRLPTYDTQADDGARRQSMTWPANDAFATDVRYFQSDDNTSVSWRDIEKTLVEEQLVDGDCQGSCVLLPGEVATADYRVIGTPRVTLDVTTETTHLSAIVVEVLPNGAREVVARGFLDTRNRNGIDRTEPHQLTELTVTLDLWPVDIIVEAGGRLDLVLSSVNATFGVPDTTAAVVTLHRAIVQLAIVTDVEAGRVTSLYTVEEM